MLILVSKTVFVSVCTPLVAIRFGASAQLVSSDLLSCHSGGAAEEAALEREGAQREGAQREGAQREGAQREGERDKQNECSRQTQIRYSSPRKR
jgi:hypothetical protein